MSCYWCQRQQGYALLLGLMVLMVVSATWFGAGAAHRSNYKRVQTLQLSQARAALIYYAVNYIDHYGAQSAGPGHFPCPDTDPPEPVLAQRLASWSKDGPNPPCGKQQVASGWLPRHVNVIRGRYHFHVRSQQRLHYAVSSQFINNPTNRVVNAESVGDIRLGQFNDVIAVLSLPSHELNINQNTPQWPFDELITNSAYAVVRSKDILKPLLQRVGSWLVSQLNASLERHCSAGSSAAICAHERSLQVKCDAPADAMLLHWLTRSDVDSNCPESTEDIWATPLWLEEVPLKRHWFVRNRWYQFVDLHIDEACKQNQVARCQFVFMGIHDGSDSDGITGSNVNVGVSAIRKDSRLLLKLMSVQSPAQ